MQSQKQAGFRPVDDANKQFRVAKHLNEALGARDAAVITKRSAI
jgi:hypothetical protein